MLRRRINSHGRVQAESFQLTEYVDGPDEFKLMVPEGELL